MGETENHERKIEKGKLNKYHKRMNAKLEEIKDKNILLPKMRIKKGRK